MVDMGLSAGKELPSGDYSDSAKATEKAADERETRIGTTKEYDFVDRTATPLEVGLAGLTATLLDSGTGRPTATEKARMKTCRYSSNREPLQNCGENEGENTLF